jgi:type IV secretory pathway VirD2 relaxase
VPVSLLRNDLQLLMLFVTSRIRRWQKTPKPRRRLERHGIKMKNPRKSTASKAGEEREFRPKVRLGKGQKLVTGRSEQGAAKTFLRAVQMLAASTSFRRGRNQYMSSGKGSFTNDAPNQAQRVVVKTRVVKGAQLKSLKAHIGYICRPGVEREEGQKVEIYGGEGEELTRCDLNRWAEQTTRDRHQFWLIVSPENAQKLDLQSYTTELVKQMEKDLGTELDWTAVNHYNTDTPHIHLMIRGRNDRGKDLVIARDYIANGVRNRAREIATSRLGRRTELEIRAALSAEIKRLRLTQIDRDLLSQQRRSPDRTVDLRTPRGREESTFALFRRTVQLQRVQELAKLSLARQVRPGVWSLSEETEPVLRELGIREDIIKTMHRSLRSYPRQERIILAPNAPQRQEITGIVVEKGLRDELYSEKYLVVVATDNRAYYVPLSRYSEQPGQESERGSRVQITIRRGDGGPGAADRNISELARLNGGIYDTEQHRQRTNRQRLPPGVTVEQYLEGHRKRLAALERKGLAQKLDPGRWRVPADLGGRLEQMAQEKPGQAFALVKPVGLEPKRCRDLSL